MPDRRTEGPDRIRGGKSRDALVGNPNRTRI